MPIIFIIIMNQLNNLDLYTLIKYNIKQMMSLKINDISDYLTAIWFTYNFILGLQKLYYI